MTDATLNDAAKAMLDEPFLANLATVGLDGTPHVTPVWFGVDGDEIIVNAVEGRAKVRNLRRVGRAAISVVDPADPYRVVAFQGDVVGITEEGADAHIDTLARKYLGVDTYPLRQPGEKRVMVRIHPRRVLMQPES